ncbi:hypothetical protein CYMTET_48562 [Cymbomonas tetramitiformis]|uniref:Uncharacterized protein n=2 Tax=Cymbomonas tetramitiformis TaxID=36881 RepID=A0AAE0EUV9_9CHLO|nr:hypothetical protein CYMTET_48562 [Cymbomonas tetramitiformis]
MVGGGEGVSGTALTEAMGDEGRHHLRPEARAQVGEVADAWEADLIGGGGEGSNVAAVTEAMGEGGRRCTRPEAQAQVGEAADAWEVGLIGGGEGSNVAAVTGAIATWGMRRARSKARAQAGKAADAREGGTLGGGDGSGGAAVGEAADAREADLIGGGGEGSNVAAVTGAIATWRRCTRSKARAQAWEAAGAWEGGTLCGGDGSGGAAVTEGSIEGEALHALEGTGAGWGGSGRAGGRHSLRWRWERWGGDHSFDTVGKELGTKINLRCVVNPSADYVMVHEDAIPEAEIRAASEEILKGEVHQEFQDGFGKCPMAIRHLSPPCRTLGSSGTEGCIGAG